MQIGIHILMTVNL